MLLLEPDAGDFVADRNEPADGRHHRHLVGAMGGMLGKVIADVARPGPDFGVPVFK